MPHRLLPADMTTEQLADRERYFRAMAVTAYTSETKQSLLRLAEKYEKLVKERGRGP